MRSRRRQAERREFTADSVVDGLSIGGLGGPGRFAHPNVFVAGYGNHESSWKVTAVTQPGALDLGHSIAVACTAERGVVDSLFFADAPGVAEFRPQFMAQSGFDPIDLSQHSSP